MGAEQGDGNESSERRQATGSKQLAPDAGLAGKDTPPAGLGCPGLPFPSRGAQCPPGSMLPSVVLVPLVPLWWLSCPYKDQTGDRSWHFPRVSRSSHPPLKSSSSWIPSHTPVLASAWSRAPLPACLCTPCLQFYLHYCNTEPTPPPHTQAQAYLWGGLISLLQSASTSLYLASSKVGTLLPFFPLLHFHTQTPCRQVD